MVYGNYPTTDYKYAESKKIAASIEKHLLHDGGEAERPPYPWPVTILQDCLQANGRLVWPWPSESWHYNEIPLTAMKLARRAIEVFSVDPAKWERPENDFFIWMYEESEV